jgi:hypothetical protein
LKIKKKKKKSDQPNGPPYIYNNVFVTRAGAGNSETFWEKRENRLKKLGKNSTYNTVQYSTYKFLIQAESSTT